MNIYIGVTDTEWREQLSLRKTDEVNFWKPSGSPFKALRENELFLFKAKYPENKIVGGGFFSRYCLLTPSMAWKAFGIKNGRSTYEEFQAAIYGHREKGKMVERPTLGCIILTEPFWFPKEDWFEPPEWGKSIVAGKTYSTEDQVGRRLYGQVQLRMPRAESSRPQRILQSPGYIAPGTSHVLGNGGFLVAVSEAYQNRCAITGERTLPVLQAAHLKPVDLHGPNLVSNGLLLRSDVGTLLEEGYLTITPDYRVEVSRHLREDYGNGKAYYAYHGKRLQMLPDQVAQRPGLDYINWHNSNIYLG